MRVTSAWRGNTLSTRTWCYLGIGIEAAVGKDGEPIVQVCGLAQGRQHHAAGCDSCQHKAVGAASSQQNVQVAAGERGYPALADDHFAGSRSDGGMNAGAGVIFGEPA